jgi:hypothetical protein
MISTIKIVFHGASGLPDLQLTDQINLSPNTQQFDVVTLQLNDYGELLDEEPLQAVLQHITTCREENEHGVLVTLFAHGWHHGSAWNDAHFVSFRTILAGLCIRESERYDEEGHPRGRRVIGVYLAWNGDPIGSWLSGIFTNLTFSDRYKVANAIGAGNPLYRIVRSLIHATKTHLNNVMSEPSKRHNSPLLLTGHSMGAILVELAFLSILKADEADILDMYADSEHAVIEMTRDNKAILAPDLVLALNSAADSGIAIQIKQLLEQQQWKKVAKTPNDEIRYNPPVLLSLTSESDRDTRILWRVAMLGDRTDGHNPALFTHTFIPVGPTKCQARGTIDFGQPWHCVHRPEPAIIESPTFLVDLPKDRRVKDQPLDHIRYKLAAMIPTQANLAWIFRMPNEISENHNDIFNFKIASLVLASVQISGAVASVANEWIETFEA